METPDWWEDRKETEGIIYKYTCIVSAGGTTDYAYTVNDSIYNDFIAGGICSNTPERATYMVAYNPRDPQENVLLWHKPIFKNHKQLRYDFDSMPQRVRDKWRVKDTVIFEENETLAKTIGKVVWPQLMILGNDTLLNTTCNIKVPWGFLGALKYRELNDKNLHPDSIQGRAFMVEYDPNNAYRIRVLFDKPLNEDRNYRLEFIDVDDKTEKRLNKAAREVGKGGVVYWSVRDVRTPDILTTARMKDFLKTYRPRDKKGKPVDVEIKIVDYANLDALFE